jgi:CheY-like chemotaxis protein
LTTRTHPGVWLLVEDDENDFILFSRALTRAEPEAKVQWVQDGGEAKEYLLGERHFADRVKFPLPAVVVSDLKMPRCSGLELVQWIRHQESLRTLPFIMFSASDQQADVALAYQDGANWYLAKPSTFEALVEMLRRLKESLAFSAWKGLP